MKRTIKFLALLAAALIGLQSCEKDDQLIKADKLPSEAKSFLDANYPDVAINSVVKDYDDATHTYKVSLSDGTYVEFRKSGEWKEVENRVSGVRDSVVPTKILSYVKTNYPDELIVDIEHERGYDVELGSGLDLDFSSDGEFVRVDN